MGSVFGSPTSKDTNLETFHLVWLDAAANDTEEDVNAKQLLRTSINHLKIFNDDTKCDQYIRNVSEDDRIVLIISGQLGRELVPRIHQLRQISSIYVYCMNEELNKEWAKDFQKVRGVVIVLDDLVAQIRLDQATRNKHKVDEPFSISVFDTKYGHNQWTTGPNSQFIYSQLLIDCLTQMPSIQKSKDQLIALCHKEYKDNKPEVAIVREFGQDYQSDRALWWFTRDSFVYRLLSKALCVQDNHLLFLFRFIVQDINQKLKQYQCSTFTRTYRGRLMSNDELKIFKESTGKFLSMNSFLSTIPNREKVIDFVKSSLRSDDLHQVLFEIEADPQLNSIKPFASIKSHSYHINDSNEEILFMVGSIFQVIDIRQDEDQIWTIKMKLCTTEDPNLVSTFGHVKNASTGSNEDETLVSFGHILHRLGKLDEAEKYCHRLIDELHRNQKVVSDSYNLLGTMAYNKGDMDLSVKYYNKSLENTAQKVKANNPSLIKIYNSVADVYRKKGDYKESLDSYNKVLIIIKEVFGEEHLQVGECYKNMGIVYQKQKKYYEALNHYVKALVIFQKEAPTDHYELGTSINNIGECYTYLDLFDLALLHYDLALKTFGESSLPQNRNIASTLHSKGYTYEQKKEFKQALSLYQQANNIYRQALTTSHPSFIKTEEDIERVSGQLQ